MLGVVSWNDRMGTNFAAIIRKAIRINNLLFLKEGSLTLPARNISSCILSRLGRHFLEKHKPMPFGREEKEKVSLFIRLRYLSANKKKYIIYVHPADKNKC